MTAFNNKLDEGTKTEWITPPEITRPLGWFDLDPCAPTNPPYQIAEQTFNITHDGLAQDWFGRVWLNPPYDENLYEWLRRMHAHMNGVALIFARTDTEYFEDFIWTASAVLFLNKRITFLHVDGRRAEKNSGAPSVLVAYGDENARVLKASGHQGKFIVLTENQQAKETSYQLRLIA